MFDKESFGPPAAPNPPGIATSWSDLPCRITAFFMVSHCFLYNSYLAHGCTVALSQMTSALEDAVSFSRCLCFLNSIDKKSRYRNIVEESHMWLLPLLFSIWATPSSSTFASSTVLLDMVSGRMVMNAAPMVPSAHDRVVTVLGSRHDYTLDICPCASSFAGLGSYGSAEASFRAYLKKLYIYRCIYRCIYVYTGMGRYKVQTCFLSQNMCIYIYITIYNTYVCSFQEKTWSSSISSPWCWSLIALRIFLQMPFTVTSLLRFFCKLLSWWISLGACLNNVVQT